MITLAQFVAHWNGRPCDFDGYYGEQCVDLADFYLRDVWGIPPFFVTGAVNLFGHRPDVIQWIKNDAGNARQFPRPGDLVIWHLDQKVGTGVNGHVDIFLKGNGLAFDGFDENWPLNTRPHVVHHSYEGVLGWGRHKNIVVPRPIVIPPVIEPPPLSADMIARVLDWLSHIASERMAG